MSASPLTLAPDTRRLTGVRFRGRAVAADVSDAVVGTPTLELSLTRTSELVLRVHDPDLELIDRLFLLDTPATVLGLPFDVAAVEVGGNPGPEVVTVTLRSSGVRALRERKGALVRRNVSRTDFARLEARGVGLNFRGQPSAKQAQVSRQAVDKGSEADPETSWTALERMADELDGWLLAEWGGLLTFASPKWLLANPTRSWVVRWRASSALPPGQLGSLATPNVRQSRDADSDRGTLSVQVPREQGIDVRPGDRLKLHGELPTFGGYVFLCSEVSIPVDGWSPVTVDGYRPPT